METEGLINHTNLPIYNKRHKSIKLMLKDERRNCMEAEIGNGNTCHHCILRWQDFIFVI